MSPLSILVSLFVHTSAMFTARSEARAETVLAMAALGGKGAIHLDLHWIKGWSQHRTAYAIAIVPVVAISVSGLYQIASPRPHLQSSLASGASDSTATFGANALGEPAGNAVAQWKLGRMYAAGDGVKQDDFRAFEIFRSIAEADAHALPGTPHAGFVANAFVALGSYYFEGIPGTTIKPDPERAREMYAYAASYFGDPDAQYRLGRMYLDGNGGPKDPKLAARWLSLAANKGQHQAQAVLGAMLFNGQYVPRQAASGLMWLTIACDGASPGEAWITDLCLAALTQATDEERAAALADLERWLRAQWVQNPNNE